MKRHRWAVVVTLAVTGDEADTVSPDAALLLDARRPRATTPVICFDCGASAPTKDPCPVVERDGYPEDPPV